MMRICKTPKDTLKGLRSIAALLAIGCVVSISPAADDFPDNDLLGVLDKDFSSKMKPDDPNTIPSAPSTEEKSTGLPTRKTSIKDSENDLLIAKNPTTPLQRQLWKARISLAEELPASEAKTELEQLIKQISSMELKPQVPLPEPEPPVEVVEVPDANEIKPEPKPQAAVKQTISSGTEITAETLKRFKELAQNPEQLENPLELAEILFTCGCLDEAAACYRICLTEDRRKETPKYDPAWILLQLGNCLQKQDPQAALKNYKAVVDEYPSSTWAPLAKAKSDVISWSLKDQPQSLIDQSAALSQ